MDAFLLLLNVVTAFILALAAHRQQSSRRPCVALAAGARRVVSSPITEPEGIRNNLRLMRRASQRALQTSPHNVQPRFNSARHAAQQLHESPTQQRFHERTGGIRGTTYLRRHTLSSRDYS